MTIISVDNLSMTYRSKIRRGLISNEVREVRALKNIDLDINEGSIFGLLGPNGAGKTTLIKCLTTLLIPTKGTATINGYDIHKDDREVRASIGAMLMGERGLYWKLTARENLEYFGQLYSIPKPKRRDRIEEIIELLELDEFADRPVESYSSGQKMKAAFGKALINDPPVLILDEPTIAMDVQGARKLRQVVKEMPERGKTVIYTTHLMHEAHELCDDLAIIDRGEIIARDDPDGLIKKSDIQQSIEITGMISDDLIDQMSDLDYIRHIASGYTANNETHLSITIKNGGEVLPKISEWLIRRDASISTIKQHNPSLEDVFVELTGRKLSQDTEVRA